MHVLVVSPQFYPLIGGYERQMRLLASEWVERGHRVTIATERRGRWPWTERLEGANVIRHPVAVRRWLHGPTSALGRGALLTAIDFDALVINMPPRATDIAALRLRVLQRPRAALWRFATADARDSIAASRSALRNTIRSWLSVGGTGIVVMSEQMRGDVIGYGAPSDRIVCIPNGARSAELQHRKDLSRHRVLFVGRLSKEKDPVLAVDTLAHLKAADERAHLTVVGDGPLRATVLERSQRLGVEGSLSMVGAADSAKALASSDVLLQTSIYEGMSNVLLEAMAQGVPFVTTAGSGARDLIGSAKGAPPGIVLGTRDPAALASAVAGLLSNETLRDAMGGSGRDLVASRYSTAIAGRAYLDAFATHRDGATNT